MLLDGQRPLAELSTALLLRGASITQSQLLSFLGRLDEGGFLEGPRAEYRFEQRRAAFLAQPIRAAVPPGGAHPGGLGGLAREVATAVPEADGSRAVPSVLRKKA